MAVKSSKSFKKKKEGQILQKRSWIDCMRTCAMWKTATTFLSKGSKERFRKIHGSFFCLARQFSSSLSCRYRVFSRFPFDYCGFRVWLRTGTVVNIFARSFRFWRSAYQNHPQRNCLESRTRLIPQTMKNTADSGNGTASHTKKRSVFNTVLQVALIASILGVRKSREAFRFFKSIIASFSPC